METRMLGRIALAISLSMLTCVQLCVGDVTAQNEPAPPVTAPPPDLASVTSAATTSTGTQVIDVSQLASPGVLSFDQPFQNLGQLYLISTNSSVTSATLAAPHIVNGTGAVISTNLPTSIAAPGALAGLNLILNATALNGTVYNAGTISSAGNLTINAQNIVNSLPSGVSGSSPVMQAIGSLNINNVANLINSGQMIAINNNININTASQIAQSLSVIANGGVFEALNGAINFRDDQFGDIKANLSILGGDFLSRELNMHSGKGVLNAEVTNTTGLVSLVGGELNFHQSTGILHLVHTVAKGDPEIFADGIDISGAHFTNGFDIGFHGNLLYSSGPLIISTSGGNVGFSGTSNRTYLNLAFTSIDTGGGALLIDHGDITLGPGSYIDTSGSGTEGGGRVFIKASGDLIANNITINSGGGDIRLGGGIGYADDNFTLLPFEHNVELRGSTIYSSGATLQIGAPTGSINMQGSTIDTSGVAYRNGSVIQDSGIVQIGAGQSVNGGSIISPHGDITVMSGTKVIFSVLQDVFTFGLPVEREYGGSTSLESVAFTGSNPGGLTVWAHQGSTNVGDISGPGSAIVAFAKDELVVSKIANDSPNIGGSVQLSGYAIRTGEIHNSAVGKGGEVKIVATNSLLVANIDAAGDVGGSVSVSVLDGPLEYFSPIIAKGLSGGGAITFVSLRGNASIISQLDASTESGKGGLINLSAAGSLHSLNFDAKSHYGDGGTVRLKAGTDLYAPHTIDVSAAVQGNGGRIDIDAGTLVGTSAGTLLKADGAGAGNGGIVNVSFAGSGGTPNVEVLARGGAASGNGGQISWTARNGDLTIDPHSWNVGVRGSQGNGGIITLQATKGQILLTDGNLIANGKGGGIGGSLTMRTIGSGDIILPNNMRLYANGAQGGEILIDSAGSLNTGAGGLVANSTTEGNGGTITLTAANEITIAGTVQANGRGAGNGGKIIVTSHGTGVGSDDGGGGDEGGGVIIGLAAFTALEDPDAAVSVNLERSIQAKAGTIGHGGTITITNDAGSIQFISTEPQSINADGGTSSGDGGNITMTSSADLMLDATAISCSAPGEGKGGEILLWSVGKLTVNSNLRANGGGTGDGGVIDLTSGISLPADNGGGGGGGGGGEVTGFALSAASTRPIQLSTTGRIAADAGTSGKGGQITLKALTGSVSISDSLEHNQITVRGGSSDGNGGTISVTANGDIAVIGNVSSSARGSGIGGLVDFNSTGSIDVQSTVTANGSNSGSGGTITAFSSSDMQLNGNFKAMGQETGNGGDIQLHVGGDLLLMGTISANGGSEAGNGGSIQVLVAGEGNSYLTGNLSAKSSDGSGGFVFVQNPIGVLNIGVDEAGLPVGTTIQVDADTHGSGGTIVINGNEIRGEHTNILARAGQETGNGGNVSITATSGLSMTGDVIDVSARGSGNGGILDLTSVTSDIGLLASLRADGGKLGDGGKITLGAAGSLFGTNENGIITARGGVNGGAGGNIELNGNSLVQLTTSSITTISRGNAGNAGHIKIASDGDIYITVSNKITAAAHSLEGDGGVIAVKSQGETVEINGDVDMSSYVKGNAGVFDTDYPNSGFIIGGILFGKAANGTAGYWRDVSDSDKVLNGVEFTGTEIRGGTLILGSTKGSVTIKGNVNVNGLGGAYGGFLNLSAAKDITVDGRINASSSSTSRTLAPLPPNASKVRLEADNNILIKNGINASSTDFYTSGSIYIHANKAGSKTTPFVIGTGASNNGIGGTINLTTGSSTEIPTGGGVRQAGYLFIRDDGAGISLRDGSMINAASSIDRPHAIILHAPNGSVTISSNVDNSGLLIASGGNIAVIADVIDLTAGPTISSTGFLEGGLIELAAHEIRVGANTKILANGQQRGGTVNILPQLNLLVNVQGLNKETRTPSIELRPQQQTFSLDTLAITGVDLTVSAVGNESNGGRINITGQSMAFSLGSLLLDVRAIKAMSAGTIAIEGGALTFGDSTRLTATANGFGLASGGTVKITSEESLAIVGRADLFARSSKATSGTVEVSTKGRLVLNGSLSINGQNGGLVSLNAEENLIFSGSISALSTDSIVKLNSSTGSIELGLQDEVVNIIDSKGTVNVTSAGSIFVNQKIRSTGAIKLETSNTQADLILRSSITGLQSITVDVWNIQQSTPADILQSTRGAVSINTRTTGSLGEFGTPFTLQTQELSLNTEGSAVIQNLNVSSTVTLTNPLDGNSINGSLVFSTDNVLNTKGALKVKESANITAERIGYQGIFEVKAINDSLSLFVTTTKGSASITAPSGNIVIQRAATAESFTLTTQTGRLTLDGNILAGGMVTLTSQENQITLNAGSSIIATGNIAIRTGAQSAKLTDERSLLQGKPGMTIASGGGTVKAPSGWADVTLQGNNYIEVRPKSNIIEINPGGAPINLNGATLRSTGKVKALAPTPDESFRPVAFVSVAHNVGGIFPGELKFGMCHDSSVYAEPSAEILTSDRDFSVLDGHVLLNARHNLRVVCGELNVVLKKRSLVDIQRSAQCVSITNLNDNHRGSVRINHPRGFLVLGVGEQLVVGQELNYTPARRESDFSGSFSQKACTREISIPFHIQENKLVRLFRKLDSKGYTGLLRMTACLQLITATHGNYK